MEAISFSTLISGLVFCASPVPALTKVCHQRDSVVPVYLLIPLAAAALYALASILIKRSLGDGVTMDQSFHLSNLVLGVVFLPLLFIEPKEIEWSALWMPGLQSLVFLTATWLTFLSLKRGDVSLVTPLMGTKVVFVAIGMTFLTGRSPGPALWIAAVLTALGIFIMGRGDMHGGRHVVFTIVVTLLSAAFFGLHDVILNSWGNSFGALAFLSLTCIGVAFGTLIIWGFQGRPGLKIQSKHASRLWWGVTLMGFQSLVLGLALGYFDDATGINVMYASRGLWVIVLVILLGHRLGNREHKQPGKAFSGRVIGTVLLTVAIVIAVLAKSRVL